jgi:hypothetical protein
VNFVACGRYRKALVETLRSDCLCRSRDFLDRRQRLSCDPTTAKENKPEHGRKGEDKSRRKLARKFARRGKLPCQPQREPLLAKNSDAEDPGRGGDV